VSASELDGIKPLSEAAKSCEWQRQRSHTLLQRDGWREVDIEPAQRIS
jgi:hypothetical protein